MIAIDTDLRLPPQEYGIIPRPKVLAYGSPTAGIMGLEPVEAGLDELVDPSDYKEKIQECIDQKIFAEFHQANSWAPPGTEYNQSRASWCWTWGGSGNIMDTEATEDSETVILGANSMGWLVNWDLNRGNYLASFIRGAKERGVAPASMCGGLNSIDNNPRNFHAGWEKAALSHRLGRVWDTDANNGDDRMIQHCISILCYGRPLYVAFSWWGHALSCIGMRWDETKYKNLIWILRNSHGEREPIQVFGTKAIPDEAYGFVSTIAA